MIQHTTYVPCVYALLPGKSKTGYLTMFQLVREARALNSRRSTLASEWMMSDFEFNIRSAFADVFPNITIEDYASVGNANVKKSKSLRSVFLAGVPDCV